MVYGAALVGGCADADDDFRQAVVVYVGDGGG